MDFLNSESVEMFLANAPVEHHSISCLILRMHIKCAHLSSRPKIFGSGAITLVNIEYIHFFLILLFKLLPLMVLGRFLTYIFNRIKLQHQITSAHCENLD